MHQALPEYYNAIKALDSLDKKDIQEARWRGTEVGGGSWHWIDSHYTQPSVDPCFVMDGGGSPFNRIDSTDGVDPGFSFSGCFLIVRLDCCDWASTDLSISPVFVGGVPCWNQSIQFPKFNF